MPVAIKRLSARRELELCGIARTPAHWPDFHALPSERVTALLRLALDIGYKEPAQANGSRARYLYAALCRQADSSRDNAP
jgi:hypothetical protein